MIYLVVYLSCVCLVIKLKRAIRDSTLFEMRSYFILVLTVFVTSGTRAEEHVVKIGSEIQFFCQRNSFIFEKFIHNSREGSLQSEIHKYDRSVRNGFLTLKNIQFDDAGRFKCQLYSFDNINNVFELIVTDDKLNFNKVGEEKKKQFSISRNRPFLLSCSLNISEHPINFKLPQLKVKDGHVINTQLQSSAVTYTFSVNASSSMLYTCQGEDSLGIKETEALLAIVDDGTNVTYVKVRNESVMLACGSTYKHNKQWKWYQENLFDGDKLTFPVVDCIFKSSSECKNMSGSLQYEDMSTPSYSFLRFSQVDFASTGTYSCVDGINTVHKTFNVIVIDNAPSTMAVNGNIIESNGNFGVIGGETVFISCTILCSMTTSFCPRLNVTDAEYVNHTRIFHNLVYTYRVVINESRTFTCHVDLPNDFILLDETKNYTIRIETFYCPKQLVFTGNMTSTSIQRGGILNCITDAVPPVNLTWSVLNKTVKSVGGPNFASIRVYDNDTYECQTNAKLHDVLKYCDILTSSFTVDDVVPRRPDYVEISLRSRDSITLECESHYPLNKNWKWFHDRNTTSPTTKEEPIVDCIVEDGKGCTNIFNSTRFVDENSPTETKLYFPSMEFEDSGNYTCVDDLGNTEKIFHVAVQVCPTNFLISRRRLIKAVELECSVVANPAVNVTWENKRTSQFMSVGLNRATIKVTEDGHFRCSVLQPDDPLLTICDEISGIEFVRMN